jgi:hypothetical protein
MQADTLSLTFAALVEPHAVKHRNLNPAVFDENAAPTVSKTGDYHRDLG